MGPGWGRPHHNTPGTATYRPTCQATGAPGGPSKAEESQRTASPTLGLSSHSPHALGQWETQPQNSEPPARAGGGDPRPCRWAPQLAAAAGLVFTVLVRCVKEKAGVHRLLAQMGPVSCLKYARPMRPAQPVPSRLLPVPSQTLRGTAVLRHLWRAPPRPPPLSERAGEGRVQGVGKGALGAGPELGAPHPCCHQARGWTAFVLHATRSPEATQVPPSLEVLPEQPPRADGGVQRAAPKAGQVPGW